jgi:hypothetical protein
MQSRLIFEYKANIHNQLQVRQLRRETTTSNFDEAARCRLMHT